MARGGEGERGRAARSLVHGLRRSRSKFNSTVINRAARAENGEKSLDVGKVEPETPRSVVEITRAMLRIVFCRMFTSLTYSTRVDDFRLCTLRVSPLNLR